MTTKRHVVRFYIPYLYSPCWRGLTALSILCDVGNAKAFGSRMDRRTDTYAFFCIISLSDKNPLTASIGVLMMQLMICDMNTVKLLIELLSALIALIALLMAGKEYLRHKQTEYHKLFSKLNKRYESSEDIQDVIRYLRDKEPSNQRPTLYKLEVFLRFFEELGLYMQTESIDPIDVDRFFGFYLRQLYSSSRGKVLLKQLGKEEKELELLQLVKAELNIR